MHVRHVTCRTLPVKRSNGQSAIAGAAYRAGEKLYDERQEKSFNYSARSADVWQSEILAPKAAGDWARNRSQLWNAAEAAERRKDGRPARDVTFGLPWGLSRDEHETLVRDFAQEEFVDRGHVVDIAFHRYGKRVSEHSEEGRTTLFRWAEKGVPFLEQDECTDLHEPHVKIERDKAENVTGYKIFQPHAHAFVTPRAISEDGEGFEAKRNRQFDRHEQAKEWRYGWGNHVNAHLEEIGADYRVSALAPEGDGALSLKPEDMPLQSYHIEQQGVPSVVREARDFNKAHNAAIRGADAARQVHETEAAQDAETGRNSRFERLQLWWGTFREQVGAWREEIQNKARGYFETGDNDTPDATHALEPPETAYGPPAVTNMAMTNGPPDDDPYLTQPQHNEDLEQEQNSDEVTHDR